MPLGPRASRVHVFSSRSIPRATRFQYSRAIKAFDSRIGGLRGDPEQTENAAKSFHVYYRMRSVGHGEYAVDHSSYVYVFDPQGRFVKLLARDAPGHKIAEDLKQTIRDQARACRPCLAHSAVIGSPAVEG